MARGDEKKVVVVVREKEKKKRYQSGGSWKVAYADFVTAMMAFFLVLWILAMDPEVKTAIEGYFNNPAAFKKGGGGAYIVGAGDTPINFDATRLALIAREQQRRRFEEARQEIRARLDAVSGISSIDAQVEIIITDEGLRIELIEGEDGKTFFDLGSYLLTPAAATVLGEIADALSGLPNDLLIEGHTDSRQYGLSGYSNWELSADRANAARRALEANGVVESRIIEVRGHADRELRNPEDPYDPTNRRVSILLPFRDPSPIETIRPLTFPSLRGDFGD